MLVLPIKSRIQILKEREENEAVYYGKYLIIIVSQTPEKNIKITKKQRATNFCRLLVVVTKKIDNKAVIRNKFRRRIKEAFKKININLLKNKYDYQLIAKHSIFNATFDKLIVDIENILSDKNLFNFKKRSK